MRRRLTLALFMAFPISVSALTGGAAIAGDCDSMAQPGLDWSECSKKSIIIPGSNLEGANLAGTDFTGTDLGNSVLQSANLEKAGLMRASLAGAKAAGANFSRIEAYRANFATISADGAIFASAELQRADLSGASLKKANFEKAELGRVNFQKSLLTDARFSLANLSRADLTGAMLDGKPVFDRAFMFRTRIEGVDLSAAQGLIQPQIDLACGDGSTKLPAGLTPPKNWPCASD
ncbi:uncharacterized protein YjbI with pentapeptide repeats [Phyllobacterium endophyticum]|jgi:uncharacterized protein YjbI with pentapeptide repeats|nr:uncharacterized protein YjbI with pentapeptide repeats [Phyllobacterium endophyticum]